MADKILFLNVSTSSPPRILILVGKDKHVSTKEKLIVAAILNLR